VHARGAPTVPGLLVAGERGRQRVDRALHVEAGRVAQVGHALEHTRALGGRRVQLAHQLGGGVQVRERLLPREAVRQRLGGAQRPFERPLAGRARQPVVGGDGGGAHVGRDVGRGFKRLGGADVQALPARPAEPLVERLPHQRVVERVGGALGRSVLHDEAGRQRLLHGVQRRVLLQAGDDGQQVEVTALAEHRRGSEHAPARVRQARHAPPHGLADLVGDRRAIDRDIALPATVALVDHAALGEVADDLLDEERVAVGLRVQAVHEVGRHVVSGRALQQLGDLLLAQPRQRQPLDQPLAAQVGERLAERVRGREVGGAVGPRDEQRPVGEAHEVAQEQQRGRVGPVQVVQHQHHRALLAEPAEEGADGVEEGLAACDGGLGVTARDRVRAGRQQRVEAVDRVREGRHRGDAGAQRLHERLVGAHRLLVRAPEEDDGPVVVRGSGELGDEPRLAYARLSADRDEPRAAGAGVVERGAQPRQRLRPPDHDGTAPGRGQRPGQGRAREERGRGAGVGRVPRRPPDLAGRDRRPDALQLERPERAEDVAAPRAHQPADEVGGDDLPGLRGVAQALRDDDGRADEVGADPHRLAGVQPHAQHGALAAGADRLLHGRRAGHRPAGGRERHHQPVAEALHLLAAVAADLRPQEREVLAQRCRPLVVPEAPQQVRGPGDVGEEERGRRSAGHRVNRRYPTGPGCDSRAVRGPRGTLTTPEARRAHKVGQWRATRNGHSS
jgi:hypothetical protein